MFYSLGKNKLKKIQRGVATTPITPHLLYVRGLKKIHLSLCHHMKKFV